MNIRIFCGKKQISSINLNICFPQCFSTDTLALASCPTAREVVKKAVGEVRMTLHRDCAIIFDFDLQRQSFFHDFCANL